MGDYDYVPDVIRDLGGKVVSWSPNPPRQTCPRCTTNDGKLLLGLPGNPVSAAIGCQRLGIPLLAFMAGKSDWLPKAPVVQLANSGSNPYR